MKKIIIAAILPIAALFATSSMAATDHHQKQKQTHTAQTKQSNQKWRSGQYLPSNYQPSSFTVDHQTYRQLSQPSRGQQWYKVKSDYILVNSKDHRIIRVL